MTQGCRFQEKSFSVAVEAGKTVGYCQKCGSEITGVVYKLNGESLCQVCFSNTKTRIRSVDLGCNTVKDKLWDFIDMSNFGKPIHITSRRQWEKECKKRGLVQIMNKDLKNQENMTIPSYKPVPRREIRDAIFKEIQARGVYDKFKIRGRK